MPKPTGSGVGAIAVGPLGLVGLGFEYPVAAPPALGCRHSVAESHSRPGGGFGFE